jgi:hypothetical protein
LSIGTSHPHHDCCGGDISIGKDKHDVGIVGEGIDEGGECAVPDLDGFELGAHSAEREKD